MRPYNSSHVEYHELQPRIAHDAPDIGQETTPQTANDNQKTDSEIKRTILHVSRGSAFSISEDEHTFVSNPSGNDGDNQWQPRQKLHWAVPSTMIGSFLVAAVLAIGHHTLYLRYDGARLDESLNQQWTNTIGTAFAFLVKLFAAIAASTAYVQRQWLVLRTRPFKLSDVDSLSGVLRDPSVFLDFRLWACNPILTFLALVAWLVPIAAVVTPGTLSVHGKMFEYIINAQVPQLSYNEDDYAVLSGVRPETRPTAPVSQVAYQSALSGVISQIPSQYPNATYNLQFYGPAIKCNPADERLVTAVIEDINPANENVDYPGTKYNYLSFTPGASINLYEVNTSHVDQVVASLYKADGYVHTIFVMGTDNAKDLVECRLGNYSYDVLFDFAYPTQSINIKSNEYINEIIHPDYVLLYPEKGTDVFNLEMPHAMIMTAFERILIGSASQDRYEAYPLIDSSLYYLTAVDWTTQTAVIKGMEEMFKNVTLSMFSSASLTLNSTRAAFVPVTVSKYVNTYVYKPHNLLFAYGITIGCAFLCTLLGLHALLQNHAGYSNRFSTAIRTTHGLDIHELAHASDCGADPLPKELANTRVNLASSKT